MDGEGSSDMSDQTLTEVEIADLRCLAGTSPSTTAGDDTIFSDIFGSIGRDRNDVRAAQAMLRSLGDGARRRPITIRKPFWRPAS